MFLAAAKRTPVNLEEWAVQMMERHNRKSHLAPQLSPSTQAVLRGEPTVSPSKELSASTVSQNPTSGDIPIGGEDIKTSPSDELPTVERAVSADLNSTGMYPTHSAAFDRQGYAPRTSSSAQQPRVLSRGAEFNGPSSLPNNPRDSESYKLPIRPAPPPSGPLPQPPGSNLKNSNAPRPITNSSSYGYADGSRY